MSSRSTAIKNGLIIFLLIGVYFIILELLGLTDNVFLKFINFIFVLIGVNNTLKQTNKIGGGYFQKLINGVLTVFIGMFLSAITLFVYLKTTSTDISAFAMTLIPAETDIQFVAVIFLEGFTSSLMILFIMMQYWKNGNFSKE